MRDGELPRQNDVLVEETGVDSSVHSEEETQNTQKANDTS